MEYKKSHSALTNFKARMPLKPYATDDLGCGLGIYSKAQALLKAYVQPNHPYYQHCLVFDIDTPAAIVELDYGMIGVPQPNLITENPENGHAHFVYLLDTPIYKTDASRQKPIVYGNAILRALQRVLDADVGYSGLITKNPFSTQWRVYVRRQKPYSLGELNSYLEITWKEANKPIQQHEATDLGRNCCMFHTVRHWAYKEVRKYRGKTYSQWLNAVIAHCMSFNEGFPQPMSYNEVKGIAKSISRYCWKKDPHCYQEFIDRQTRKSALGASKGGLSRSATYTDQKAKAFAMKQSGLNNTQIAKELGLNRRTIIRWLNSLGV